MLIFRMEQALLHIVVKVSAPSLFTEKYSAVVRRLVSEFCNYENSEIQEEIGCITI